MELYPISGTTLTEFSVIINPSVYYIEWGDGTVSTPKVDDEILIHKYDNPGLYNITINTCESSFVSSICVDSSVTESIFFSEIPDNIIAGNYELFTLVITSTNPKETVTFYSSGSNSTPHNLNTGFWDHLKPRWSFSEKEKYNFLYEKTLTGSSIYNGDSIIGYSFEYNFYYKDDMPGNPIIFATLDRGLGVNSRLYAATQVEILSTTPLFFKITEDGINEIYPIQYEGKKIPYTITICNEYGNIMHYMSGQSIDVDIKNLCDEEIITEDVVTFENIFDNCGNTGGYLLSSLTISGIDLSSSNVSESIDCVGDTTKIITRSSLKNNKIICEGQVEYLGNIFSLSGESSSFSVYPFDEYYKLRRVDEDLNLGETLFNIAGTDRMKNHSMLWEYINAVLGPDISSLGTICGFKINKFVDQHSDIQRCNINSLINYSKMYDLELDDYSLNLPADIQRVLDIFSIPMEKLIGTSCMCNMSFSKCDGEDYVIKCNYCGNETTNKIGDMLNPSSIIFSGEDILYKEKSGNVYEVHHVLDQDGNDNYPLSSLSSIDVNEYCFYRWNKTQKGNIINSEITYDNPDSDWISSNQYSIDDWYKDGGILDEILLYKLMKGLNLN